MNKLLKQSDIDEIKRWHDNDHMAKLLSELKDWADFEVEDVLVKRDLANGNLVEVSGTCKVPRKYKIVSMDDLGIPWVKQVSVRGGLGNKLYPLLHFTPTRFKFEIDPEKLDAIILGHKYDPRIEYKRMRDNNPKYGRD